MSYPFFKRRIVFVAAIRISLAPPRLTFSWNAVERAVWHWKILDQFPSFEQDSFTLKTAAVVSSGDPTSSGSRVRVW